MDILLEVTEWNTSYEVKNHVYLIEGNKMHGYIPDGQKNIVFFAKPQSFDKRKRDFVKLGTFPASKLPKPAAKVDRSGRLL